MTQTAETMTPADRITGFAMAKGIAMVADFVPFSQSRNAKEKNPSLNWKVTLSFNGGRDTLTTDYMAGSGHAPSYKNKPKTGSHLQHEAIKWECEHGRKARVLPGGTIMGEGKVLQPKIEDILSSLALDSDVIDCASFEEWASNYGYNTDSREAEKTYRLCLEHALKLRAAIGDAGLTELREACQDY